MALLSTDSCSHFNVTSPHPNGDQILSSDSPRLHITLLAKAGVLSAPPISSLPMCSAEIGVCLQLFERLFSRYPLNQESPSQVKFRSALGSKQSCRQSCALIAPSLSAVAVYSKRSSLCKMQYFQKVFFFFFEV